MNILGDMRDKTIIEKNVNNRTQKAPIKPSIVAKKGSVLVDGE
jgi:hypothetical protein